MPGECCLQSVDYALRCRGSQLVDFRVAGEVIHYHQVFRSFKVEKICSDLLPRIFREGGRDERFFAVCGFSGTLWTFLDELGELL